MFCAIQPRFAPALPDKIQAFLRVPHPKACSATVKVSRIIAPESRPFAKVFLNAAANVQIILGDNSGMVFAMDSASPLSENVTVIDIHTNPSTISAFIETDERYEG